MRRERLSLLLSVKSPVPSGAVSLQRGGTGSCPEAAALFSELMFAGLSSAHSEPL